MEELNAGADRFKFSLIAKFSNGRPSITKISGRATICDIWDERHILIILDSEELLLP